MLNLGWGQGREEKKTASLVSLEDNYPFKLTPWVKGAMCREGKQRIVVSDQRPQSTHSIMSI